jgi:hypothetical protein
MLRLMGLLKENGLDRDGNSMAPGVTVQNRIEEVFVEAPAGESAKNIIYRVEVRELGKQSETPRTDTGGCTGSWQNAAIPGEPQRWMRFHKSLNP